MEKRKASRTWNRKRSQRCSYDGDKLQLICEAEYYSDSTTPSEYDFDNSTIEYSFFSNSSIEELDKFIDGMIDEEEEVEEEEVTFTTAATSRETTERGGSRGGSVGSSASLPVCLELTKLLWTSMILVVLNLQQL
ncbi:uncharacterized protein si:ch211-191i18.2 isoform X1 [Gambusia affinis]|uniref:uncharacterized protein si:ch211-191i18.2 isoform X1 n=1 Tax=Gambusia affinis TaxID=33528 RepID=UPI001CDD45B7|nr:uncharacterized protein si:ch211-191i18.2 isoform X1 [Gambusia affinis]